MIELLEKRRLYSQSWFVSPTGANSNPGTLAQPFQTIQQAANEAQPGDTVYILGGIYRETVTPANSGTPGEPITYTAYNNESVEIDGADPITGWTQSSSSIYTATQSWDLGTGNNELFLNGSALNEASWPNTPAGSRTPNTAEMKSVSLNSPGTAGNFADTATIYVSGLSGGAGAWVGATIHFGAGENWVIQTGTVVASGNGTLTFAYTHNGSYQTPQAGNRFYLTGVRQALNSGEWYLNANGALSLWPANGASPASSQIEAKHREFGFELSNLSYINIQNIHLFATSIDTNSSSNHINLDQISAEYVSQKMLNPEGWTDSEATTGIILLGSNIDLADSTINWSSGNGVYLGGNNNAVDHTTITNVDYSGSDAAAITIAGASDVTDNNTIQYTGRDGIRMSSATKAIVEYNTISTIGLQTTDLGAIYTWGNDSLGSVIAYNTISNIYTGGFGGDGLYLDNGSAEYTVHDNVISNVQIPIKMNLPSYSNNVYHNKVNGKYINSPGTPSTLPGAGSWTFYGKSANLTTCGTLGGFQSAGAALNDSGEVVGSALDGDGWQSFNFSNNSIHMVAGLGAPDGGAAAINDAGQIVGNAKTSDGHAQAFVSSQGLTSGLGFLPGDTDSYATGINSSGQIVGVSYSAGTVAHAFLYSDGAGMRSLGTLGGSVSQANAINDAGVVVGQSTTFGDKNLHAFRWSNGTMTDLGTLGGSTSFANAINASGGYRGRLAHEQRSVPRIRLFLRENARLGNSARICQQHRHRHQLCRMDRGVLLQQRDFRNSRVSVSQRRDD